MSDEDKTKRFIASLINQFSFLVVAKYIYKCKKRDAI